MACECAEIEISTDSYSPVLRTTNAYNKFQFNSDGRFFNEVISDSMLFEFENINITEVLDLSIQVSGENEIELGAFVLNDNSQVVYLTQRKEFEFSSF